MKKLISVVTPVYNEEGNLFELSNRLKKVFADLPQYDFEVILVENGSADKSWEYITQICNEDKRFKSVRLSRNFTAPGGITAGLRYAAGDASVVMCSDLQDPPEKIPLLIAKWEEGYDVAYQIISKRHGISLFYKACSNFFHWLMSALTQNSFPRNGSVFRIMDACVVRAFNQLNETNRYFTGLCNWIGFKSVGVEFARESRFAGEAKSQFIPTANLALNAIFAFSHFPLKLVTVAGLTLTGVGVLYMAFLLVHTLVYGTLAAPGLVTATMIMVSMFGALFLFIGVIGEYLARIYDEVKRRPTFLVKKTLGLVDEQAIVYRGVHREGRIELLDRPYPTRGGEIRIELQPMDC